MKKLSFPVLAIAGFLLLAGSKCKKTDQPDPDPIGGGATASDLVGELAETVLKDKFIVVLNDSVHRSVSGSTYDELMANVQSISNGLLGSLNIPLISQTQTFGAALTGFVATMSADQAEKLETNPMVQYVESDRIIGYAPFLGGLLGGGSPPPSQPAQVTPWGVMRTGSGSGKGKVAWIIDTGIEFDHPDLDVDKFRSRSFTGSSSANDDNGHGTHVAGIVGAKNNDIGVIGVAYDATLVAVKVLNKDGSGTLSGVVQGVDYVTYTGSAGNAANLSLSGGVYQSLDDAVKGMGRKGIFVSLAAGNSSKNAINFSPARANGTNIYTVSAFDKNDKFASFSNYGEPPLDYCEPGVTIKSTILGGKYGDLSGTSMAAPHLAGILLITNGKPRTDGFVTADPDGDPDPIGHK